jgi:hypothetical protein
MGLFPTLSPRNMTSPGASRHYDIRLWQKYGMTSASALLLLPAESLGIGGEHIGFYVRFRSLIPTILKP